MSSIRLVPGAVRGRCEAPPSKSYTHRALAVAHLARRRFRVERPLDSDDTRATAAALEALGSRVTFGSLGWTVAPGPERDSTAPCTIDCGESGTTLRFACALAAVAAREVTITGRGRLPRRPVDPLLRALRTLGARWTRTTFGSRTLPVKIRGPITGGRVAVDASESSQFASALLLVAPVLARPTRLVLRGRIVSRPYLDATLAVLHRCGIDLAEGDRSFEVPGGQRYRGSRYRVPGDASSAAYLWTAAAVTTGPVEVRGIPPEWPQADLAILDLLSASGARVRRNRNGATVTAGHRRAFSVDLTASPDLYPLAGVLGALTPGTSRLAGAPHIVLKESDRRAGTERLATSLGARVRRTATGLAIEGGPAPRGFSMLGETDHRVVMSAAVGALAARGPSRIGNAQAVRKSFPEFWNAINSLRVGLEAP